MMNIDYQKINASELHYVPSSHMHPANTRFHFSFAHYYNPQRMGFGVLRVLNDDEIKPQNGFGRHPHQDMEIISYVIKGKLTHWDSVTQQQETIGRGHVQAISAGAGIRHSEVNTQDDWCRLLQIWISPNNKGGPSRYHHQNFEAKERENNLLHMVGNITNKDRSALLVNADINVYASELTKPEADITFELTLGRQAYINCIEGSLNVVLSDDDHLILAERDSLELKQPGKVSFSLKGKHAHFIIIEMAQAE